MVRKEDLSAVRIIWPEDKPGRLEKGKCVRGIHDLNACLVCHWFAERRGANGKMVPFWQRWMGDCKRMAAYILCGAPKEQKKALEGEKSPAVGISTKHKDFKDTVKSQAARRELEEKENDSEGKTEDKVAEDQTSQASEDTEEASQPADPTLKNAGAKMTSVGKGEPLL